MLGGRVLNEGIVAETVDVITGVTLRHKWCASNRDILIKCNCTKWSVLDYNCEIVNLHDLITIPVLQSTQLHDYYSTHNVM